MTDISYSDGTTIKNAVIQVWDDLSAPRSGRFRAFWCADKDTGTGCPVVGYCSPGGSHRTIRACVAEVRRLGHKDPIYRNGRLVDPKSPNPGIVYLRQ
jgi:hypothetical protein